MKVILLKDVAKIGRRFEVVTVPDGYALNKLLPNGMAKQATSENLKLISATKDKQKETQAVNKVIFSDLLKKLEQTPLQIAVETNAQGHMFQALKTRIVAEAIVQATGSAYLEENIHIQTPIKSIGENIVTLISGSEKKDVTIILIPKK